MTYKNQTAHANKKISVGRRVSAFCYLPATSDRIKPGLSAAFPEAAVGSTVTEVLQELPNVCLGSSLVCSGSPVPEPGPVVVTAGHEARVGGGVDDAAHDAVVPQGQEVPPLCSSGIPAAEAYGPFIWKQHVIFCVVEDSLCPVYLAATQTSTCVFNQRPTSGYLPEFSYRVFPTGQDILGIFGKNSGADFSSIVCLLEGGDAAVGHPIPEFDAAILAACHVHVGAGVVVDRADGICVLILGVAGHEALEGVDVVEPKGWVLGAHQDEIPRRVEGNGAEHLCFLDIFEGSFGRRL